MGVLLLLGLLFSPDYTRKKTRAGYAVHHNRYLGLDEKTADLEIFHQAIQDHRANPDVEKL